MADTFGGIAAANTGNDRPSLFLGLGKSEGLFLSEGGAQLTDLGET